MVTCGVDIEAARISLSFRGVGYHLIRGRRAGATEFRMRRMSGSLSRAAAWAGLVAQPAFVIAWLVAAAWQGPGYSVTAHTISDMYAVTAPGGLFLVVVITLCGVATVLFALFALRPALRSAGGAAIVGCTLLALSIYG